MVASLQIGLEGPGIHGARRLARLLGTRELQLDLAGDRPRDLAVKREDVAEVAVVAVAPEVLVGGGLDELRGDAHAVSGAQHRALDDGVHVQLARDLGKRLARVAVGHARGSRDHAQLLDLREHRDQGLRHAIDEIFLLGIAREVFQRQDRDGADRTRSRDGSVPPPPGERNEGDHCEPNDYRSTQAKPSARRR